LLPSSKEASSRTPLMASLTACRSRLI
jgi:hypothetical protein